ncbi:ATP-dependent RNA helicase DHX37/DHR1 [Geosmithia morbida]|uniref:RNA helicase n=1 Tax=Geosmithia morbida TaxID=1094350 RepID=A0A9P5D1K3_9HYPO|nr:ATP-dependent RNA helicase DHX37/DHR1 [Geosmithia morbida]KAF4120556.1 ATP-dependent RNA helicase DHX37/DHR1 [Geosmithia morbida]
MAGKFVPRQRKHKVLARQRDEKNSRHEVVDTNQEVLPANREQELQKKRRQMKEELRQDGMSSKKAKRLEKYIDQKLRKDENRQLLADLAKKKVDTSLYASSKALGSGRETKKQALRRAMREQKAGINDGDDILLQERKTASLGADADSDSGEDSEDEPTPSTDSTLVRGEETTAEKTSIQRGAKEEASSSQGAPAVGAGLKRPLDVDENGRPVIPKRQKRGGVKSKFSLAPSRAAEEPEHEEWGGFSSDDRSSVDKDEDHEAGSDAEDTSSSGSPGGSSDDDEDSGESDGDEATAPRVSAFKAWAQRQINEVNGSPSDHQTTTNTVIPKPANFVPRTPEQEPLPAELQPTADNGRKAFSIAVERRPEIQEARLQLPVVSEEQRIMEAIHNNDIVVICGATGSGKTTQIPQFLYEAGYGSPDSPTPGMIGVTQPRRVAAVSMSKRVATELGGSHSSKVAYQIRFEGTAKKDTAIKFMTDGVLLREVAEDLSLAKYSAIIIDEAHERSVNTDVLIGMLSRVIKLRSELAEEDPEKKPLKLVIMSATLRIEDLTMNTRLFAKAPPVLEVEGRQHPVTMHFSRKTSADYVDEAFRKIRRGHKKLPPGGFLVFLTGRNEIVHLSKRLKEAFGGLKTAEPPKVRIPASEAPVEAEDVEFGDDFETGNSNDVDDFDEIMSDDEGDEDEEFDVEENQEAAPLRAKILPLYSLLPTQEQLRVFEEVPAGTRQIILATNVAETSLTIPGIRYVFDSGRSKERHYEPLTGVQSYGVGWISKASASQRAGRAGRTGPGHCYRLYSSAVYERDFADFATPELLRMPLEGVVLQLKAMNLTKVVNFPFPTPPDRQELAKAEKVLTYISALADTGHVTEQGRSMSVFPLAPRFARILLIGHMYGCLPYTIAMVAALSSAEIFLPESQAIPELAADHDAGVRTNADVMAEDRQADARREFSKVHRTFCSLDDKSDAMKLLQVVGEFAHDDTEEWCRSHFVRYKVLKEAQQLRRQITDIVRANVAAYAAFTFEPRLGRPTALQVSALKQIVAAGFIDQVAIRADMSPYPPEQYRKPRRPIDVPYMTLSPLQGGDDPEDGLVYIHPESPMAHLSTQECPGYIVYAYLQRSAPSGLDSTKKPKTRMHSLTDLTAKQLFGLVKGTPLVSYGKPIKEVRTWVADGTSMRESWVVPYVRSESTHGQGWPMPATKLKQKKTIKGWVVVN